MTDRRALDDANAVVDGTTTDAPRWSWKPWLLASAPVWLYPLREAIALSPVGHDAWFLLEALLWPALAFAVLLLPVLLLVLLRDRAPGMQRLTAGVLVFVASTVMGATFKEPVRKAHLHRVADHGAPLVAAIARYEADNGRPPAQLQALVPRYLATIPDTGLGAHPEWTYRVTPADGVFPCARWIVAADASGFMRLDELVHCESGAQLDQLPRVGDWAVFDND